MGRGPTFDVLLFDLGGVLVDFAGFDELGRLLISAPARSEVRGRWIASRSVQSFERGDITATDFAAGVLEEFEIDLSPAEFLELFVDWARGPYPGARSLLGRLRPTYRLACLSNSNELHTPLHRRGVEPLLDRYFFSDELGLVKPDREVFEHVVSDLNTPPGRIAFFDDTPVNVKAAREVGITAFEVEGISELTAQLQRLRVL